MAYLNRRLPSKERTFQCLLAMGLDGNLGGRLPGVKGVATTETILAPPNLLLFLRVELPVKHFLEGRDESHRRLLIKEF